MPPETYLETSAPGPQRGRPLLRAQGHGNPEGSWQPPRDHILCVLYGPVVSSSVRVGGGGWALRAADMPSILSELLCLSQMCRAGRGLQEGMGRPPCPQFTEPQGSGSSRGQGS